MTEIEIINTAASEAGIRSKGTQCLTKQTFYCLAYYFHEGGFIEEFLDKVDLWKSQLEGGPTVRDQAVWSQAAKVEV